MTEIILIRHGETSWNREKRFQGHTDIPLSDQGRSQAISLARRLKADPVDAIYASDLSRAAATAEFTSQALGLAVHRLRELREIDFGDWEGKSVRSILTDYPLQAARWFKNPGRESIPGGETHQAIHSRLMDTLHRIVKAHPDQKVALFSHGGPIRYMLIGALDMNPDMFWRMEIDNTSVSVLKHTDRGFLLKGINDCAHLSPWALCGDPFGDLPEMEKTP